MKFACFVLLFACAYANVIVPTKDRAAFYIPDHQLQLKSEAHEENPIADERLAAEAVKYESINGRSLIENSIQNLLEGFRDIVINGNDVLPVLDPLEIDQVGPLEFSTTGVSASVALNNVRAEGLRWYVVDDVSVNALRLIIGLHVTLPRLEVTGSYDARARLGLLTHAAGGDFRVFIHRLEVGVDVRVGTNIIGGHLVLRELDIKIDIHDTLIRIDGMVGSSVINNFINAMLQNITQDLIQNELENLSRMLSEELFDVVNDILKEFTLGDLFD